MWPTATVAGLGDTVMDCNGAHTTWLNGALGLEAKVLSRMSEGGLAVALGPDVAAVFRSSETVNTLLRSVIAAML